MALIVEEEDNRFRVCWQEYSIGWLPDTISNRKAILVFLRLLQVFQNGKVKSLFTFRELSVLFGGNSRQAASGHVERFRKCGSDFLSFLTRKRIVYKWILDKVRAEAVYIDEKWLKIRGKWLYWLLDTQTGLPVLASLLPSTGKWACRWIGVMLKRIGKIPRVIITDGLPGYSHVMEGMRRKAKHILCHFHYQQGITRWLKKRFADKGEIAVRKAKMKRVLKTNDKRTVRRRLQKLKESAQELGISEWVQQTEEKLPKLLPSVGSTCIPRTTNAIERFFRAFNQFYKKRCGFFTLVSAKRELILFLVMYVFIRQPESGKAPIQTRNSRKHLGNFILVRYCDDFIILSNGFRV